MTVIIVGATMTTIIVSLERSAMSPIRTAFASRLLPLLLMILVAAGTASATQSAEGNPSMTTDEIKHAVLGDCTRPEMTTGA